MLKDGIDLFQKQVYSTAQTHFQDYLNAVGYKGTSSPTRYSLGEANFYYAACAVELFQDDAQGLMEKFIANYPESPKVVLAHFHLGKLFFRKRDWDKAVEQLLATDIYQLNTDQYIEYCFKLGYAYYMLKDYDNALVQFDKIKDEKNIHRPETH